MNRKTIIFDGDSWVFGSEIVDPILVEKYGKDVHSGTYSHNKENDNYRIPKIFPTHLGEKLDSNVINLSWPADDNGTILNRTITYITTNYISKGLPTDNLFVIIGWSSPERLFFWYKDDKMSHRFRLWPNYQISENNEQKKFSELYISHFWNKEEYIPRYIFNVTQFQNFCNIHGIKWMCFNSFYQVPNLNPKDWSDLNVNHELSTMKIDRSPYYSSFTNKREIYSYDYYGLWSLIDEKRFYKKNDKNNTFKSFMEKKLGDKAYNGWHPSPESHKCWSDELYNYITENKLL